MPNHYHLLVETPLANLSQGMRQLNGVYTQAFNRRHNRTGHVLQGRYKAKESHLLELARYIVLNPVRAKLVRHPRAWRWSITGPPPAMRNSRFFDHGLDTLTVSPGPGAGAARISGVREQRERSGCVGEPSGRSDFGEREVRREVRATGAGVGFRA